LVGFLLATIAALAMILGARVLHEKTPKLEEPIWVTFIADTEAGRLEELRQQNHHQ